VATNVQSQGYVNNASGNSHAWASTPTPGNLLTVTCSKFNNTSGNEFTAPSGWTEVTPASGQFSSIGNVYVATFCKIADGTETTDTVGTYNTPAVMQWDEWAPASGRNWKSAQTTKGESVETGNTTSTTFPSLTATETDGVIVGSIGFSGSNTNLAFTNSFVRDAYAARGSFHRLVSASGAVGTSSVTWTNNRKAHIQGVLFESEVAGGGTVDGTATASTTTSTVAYGSVITSGQTGTVSYVGAGAFSSSYNSTSLAMPGDIQEGDFLVAYVEYQTATPSTSWPSGWTQQDIEQYDGGDHLYVLTKFAGASEGAFVVGNSAQNAGGYVEAYRGVDPSSPFDVSIRLASEGGGTPKAPASPNDTITTTTDGAMVVAFVANATNGNTSQGININASSQQGFSVNADGVNYATAQGTDWSMGSARKSLASAGQQTLPHWEIVGPSSWGMGSFALKPSVTQALRIGWGTLI
jgi:hypothetical protein